MDPGEIIDTRNVSDRRTCHQLAGLSAAAPDLAEADEDCLYLYINVPGTWPPPEPLPVLIWFTGGAFVFGMNVLKLAEVLTLSLKDLETGMVWTFGCLMM